MVRHGVVVLGTLVVGLVALSEGRASLHHPEAPMAIPVSEKGVPEALPFEEFGRRRLVLLNAGNPKWPLENTDPRDPTKKIRTDRGVVKDRIDKRLALRNRSELDSVALAVDWLRYGQAAEATSALRDQRREFLPNITHAHIEATQGNWDRAFQFLDIANEERPPKEIPGLKPQELAWQLKLNTGPLLKLVRLRMGEARGDKPAPENELPDAIFPVNFANTVDGALAPAERAKLPPDALATVQQLVLWFPHDPRLYWLLGELYAAKGDFIAARKIMDECVGTFTYSNRKVLMQHREAVTKVADTKGPASDDPLFVQPDDTPVPAPPLSLGTVWIYFGVVGVVALFAAVRALLRLRKSNDAPGVRPSR
ncbi:: TPR_9 [Gemmata massiliana]|uniref:: TPR_9 n=1 Tax=Gemmata massiliana TaxID=1210884 RepID=A0A6P2DM65_9BACT|nr:tetratricopeptide repeat protein [Gemmata massiliana]VTS02921.1 : TPR_9 [Gemmata massiliana]